MLKRLRLAILSLCAITIFTALFFSWYGAHLTDQSFNQYIEQSNRVIARSIAVSSEEYTNKLYSPNNIRATSADYQPDQSLLRDIDALLSPQVINSSIKAVQMRNRQGVVLYSTNTLANIAGNIDVDVQAVLSKIGAGEKIISQLMSPVDGVQVYATHVPITIQGEAAPVGLMTVTTQHLGGYYQASSTKLSMYIMIALSAVLVLAVLIALWLWLRQRLQKEHKQLENLQDEYSHLAMHDSITGLCNRHCFVTNLEEFAADCAKRHYSNFAVFVMDIDHFKTVNESIGHRAGNELIKEASTRIKNTLQDKNAVVSRLGGDEFGVIVHNMCDLQNATSIAKKLLSQFRAPFRIDEKEISVSLSIGVVICQGDQVIAEEVMRDADIAMYRAKQNGRNCYELFNPHMHVEAMERIEIENDIKRGIANNEIFNRYQPIVDLQTNITHSLEALARWQHPEKGELMPSYFIQIAEETGLIHGIDKRVLRLALQDLVRWQKSMASLRDLSVSVNHSARNFSSRPTMDNIYRNLAESQMSGHNLKIELTESSIIDNETLAFSMFEELRSKGIHLCMDDFGTGFSSLSYLRKLNFDMLKIDMSFVRDMVDDIDARKIVQTMIDMGNNLGIAVTAEGVEEQEQVDLLIKMGCRYAQGFYFSRPMLADDVLPYIKAQMEQRKALQAN